MAATEPPDKRWDVLDMKKTTKQAKHMSQTANNTSTQRGKARIVALALTGVLAVGGAGAICLAGIGKSPGQAPVAAQSATSQTAKTNTAKPNTSQTNTKTADQQKSTKRTSQQKSTKRTSPQQSTKRTSQPAPQQQKQSNPAPTTQSAKQNTDSDSKGLEGHVTHEGAIFAARDYVGTGGKDQNATATGPIRDGNTSYYVVEFDLGEAHHIVHVDAVDAKVIFSDQTRAGSRILLSDNGDSQKSTEEPIETKEHADADEHAETKEHADADEHAETKDHVDAEESVDA